MSWVSDLGGLLAGAGTIYGLSRLGRTPTPSAGETTAQALEAMQAGYPGYLGMLRGEAEADAQKQLEMAQQYAPQLARQQLGLATEMMPRYGQIGRDETYRDRMSDAATGVDVLRGPGGAMIDETFAKARQIDPEFYGRRAQTSGMLGDLLRSFADSRTTDPYVRDVDGTILRPNPMYREDRPGGYFTGALSGSEREEIQRSLNQQRARSGGMGGPTAMTDVVANAMKFGQGVQNRRDALGRALGQATSFLPASRSGFDPLQVALGRPSTHFGAQQFSQPNIQQTAAQQAPNFMSNVFGAARDSAGYRANQPSTLSNIGSVMKTFPGLSW
jgi:hypothetical protein